MTEVQLYMSTSCQPGSPVIRAAKSGNKEGFSMSEKAQITSRVNKFYCHGHGRVGEGMGNSHN